MPTTRHPRPCHALSRPVAAPGRRRRAARATRSLAILGLLLCLSPAFALAPDQLLLIANRAMPQSEQLARFYAQQRSIPEDRLLLLDLPAGETLPGERFDETVILPTRQFLEQHQLREKVRCALTFYGVPLRLGPRKPSPAEDEERQLLTTRSLMLLGEVRHVIAKLETEVATADVSGLFKAGTQADLPSLRLRATAALERAHALLPTLPPQQRLQLLRGLREAIAKLGGEAALVQLPEQFDAVSPATSPAEFSRAQRKAGIEEALKQLAPLRQRRFEAAARARIRQLMADHCGLLEQIETALAQADYLQPGPIKALDSELALLWYDSYPQQQFLPNPLQFAQPRPAAGTRPPLLMVSRLDAPDAGLVREMILGGIVAQRKGLSGRFAIDSRGMHPEKVEAKDQGYARTDESLRQLADLVAARTKVRLLHDDAAEAFKANVAQDAALYVGWYKVRSYTPSFKFVPGAVAYHIASYEMVSLRNAQEKGWCRGLLLDGAAATIGAVDEPFLGAFPEAQDFFPLLMTGHFTLAETYWLTLPVVNWKMVLIGDPLYNPFEKAPAIKADDLPVRLWDAMKLQPSLP